ncbi:trp operon leader peptide [Streptomyces sp. NPDC047000]
MSVMTIAGTGGHGRSMTSRVPRMYASPFVQTWWWTAHPAAH